MSEVLKDLAKIRVVGPVRKIFQLIWTRGALYNVKELYYTIEYLQKKKFFLLSIPKNILPNFTKNHHAYSFYTH